MIEGIERAHETIAALRSQGHDVDHGGPYERRCNAVVEVKMTCIQCGKKLTKNPYLVGYGYDGNGYFCILRCGYRYALNIVERQYGKRKGEVRP